MTILNRQTDLETFQQLADRWEDETVLLSRTDQATGHPAYRAIVEMGEPAIQAILERMQAKGGHWFHALQDITGVNPVKPADRGNIAAMQTAWQKWSQQNGYARHKQGPPLAARTESAYA